MGNCIKSAIVGMGIGIVVGGIIVSKNKKLASKIDQGTDKASDKLMELKDQAEQKMQEVKQKSKKPKTQKTTKANQN